ncbi:MAG: helix-turn-helix transcriptional regulator [Clostridia bacterium]|nr:helix-turn-helix transcriptional regulator [Clostridia bacterium]
MDQIKIGKFIAERRKLKNLTQAQLAEKLNITDRAVSKWENGRSLPDSSIMLELCEMLEITVNDLLSGEVVVMEKYNKELENNLLEIVKEKERADRRLLRIETVMGFVSIALMLALCVFAAYAPIEDWMRIVLIIIGFIPVLVLTPFMIRIEQIAGYYECKKCGHRHIPKYSSVFASMHRGRTRYMKCPKCHERSWQKKVISKIKD